jgi:cytochrome c oxidase subunit 1
MNAVVHNTLWVTGHFHLTVATTVALTFFGVTYWLIPALTGRVLTERMNKLGIVQTIVWCVGMLIMSGAMHIVGLLGSPRRTAYTTYGEHADAVAWMPYHIIMAAGGVILFIGVVMIVCNTVALLKAPKGDAEYPIGEVRDNAEQTPRILERWSVWVGIAAVLILIAYAVPLMDMINHPSPGSPGFVTW